MKAFSSGLIVSFLITLAFTSCKEQTDTKAEAEKLMQISREWSKAAASGDREKTLAYWSDEAVIISANESTRKGKASIREMVEESFSMPGFKISWEPKFAEVAASGDMGYLLEETSIMMNDSTGQPTTMKFNAVTIWKKDGSGQWKSVVDVMSPAPAQ
ncbi:MAG TPA: DUF4440 domain-containing protein [Chryseosolibacter sp.]|nr:DUF4440 domain-containing protein [Chryseosolibacter sp.]